MTLPLSTSALSISIVCVTLFLNACTSASLRKGEREEIGPDGHIYTVSQTWMTDTFGPVVVISITKPDNLPEPSRDFMKNFSWQLLSRECASLGAMPTRKHISRDEHDVRVNRYTWKGITRVSWSDTMTCVKP